MECRRCAACDRAFRPRAQVPHQRYCALAACQRERRRRWQQSKLNSDADYRVPSELAPWSLFDCARYGYRAVARGTGSMECAGCGSAAVSERSERTAQGYRRFRCRACGKQFNERSAGVLNRTQYPSDIIALVVLLAPALQACPA